MIPRSVSLNFFLLFLVREIATVSALIMAKPNCIDTCGNISIPFPFGIGTGCYMNDWFSVDCNKTTADSPSRAFLSRINMEVLEISIRDMSNMVRVNSPIISSGCSGRGANSAINMTGSPFAFSSSNIFTAMGCNNRALLNGIEPEIVGCTSTCGKENSYCSGNNCCQTTIPSSLQVFNASLGTPDHPINDQGRNECKVAFIVEEEWFRNNISSPEVVQYMQYVPVILRWLMYYGTDIPEGVTLYSDANNSDAKNSDAKYCDPPVNLTSGRWGLRTVTLYSNSTTCWCSPGYDGHPYLPDGCTDIDQCKIPGVNWCSGMTKCVNVPGWYKCELDKAKITFLILGAATGLLLLLVGIWRLYKLVKKRKNIELKKKFFKRNGGLLLQQQLSSSDGSIQKTKIFTSKELEKATDRFNDNRILGQGGQGTVYKGMQADGMIVAVKKSILVDEEKLEEFINEVVILSQVNHRNVVKLLGCCLETEVPLLVYEFIPNGNLFEYIHDQKEEFEFSWEMRLRIATEVARALSYLHSAASIPVYHRDIKSTNIMLDEKFRAKVSDFGTSRSIAIDQTHLTTHVQGTFGYLDPEYFQSSQFTGKSDVYSFGVVLAELLSGQKPISYERPEDRRSLATHFILLMEENKIFDILDERLMGQDREEEVIAVANLARRCLNLNGRKRPTMREVAIELEQIRVSKGAPHAQQSCKDLENIRDEVPNVWEIAGPTTSVTIGDLEMARLHLWMSNH
ncbi:wall-associated receptor kinase-like 8 isoform X3 [Populus trichocarpa]|uniref:wall-associated receptor kinase-like 8 isoform X3 n=1 Tax=Populus trichocarpa TaxID=3694 RepID=UPI002277C223|nr:wall-associated receptor kinase-like 8 isoform X3 [Populus trichocarpa]